MPTFTDKLTGLIGSFHDSSLHVPTHLKPYAFYSKSSAATDKEIAKQPPCESLCNVRLMAEELLKVNEIAQ
jgi:hypothetical protein